MNVLAIEYSTAERSVAVIRGEALGIAKRSAEAQETGGRAANTFRMVEEALEGAGLQREEVNCVAVGLGPGSYTGIRSAISFAQGWQLATGVRVMGVPSTVCLAAKAWSMGLRGRAGVVIDAQRGEFYWGAYELETAGYREVEELRIASATEVLGAQADGYLLFGPEEFKILPGLQVVPARALTLAQIAAESGESVPAESLAPVYLRETAFVKAAKPRSV